jgi:hypothetical protein
MVCRGLPKGIKEILRECWRIYSQEGNDRIAALKLAKECHESVFQLTSEGLDIKTALDDKATKMITMSSAVATLLLGLATFIVTNINSQFIYFQIGILFIISGIISALISISLFIKSFTIRDYDFPVGHEQFFKNGKYDETTANKFITATKEKFQQHLIHEYLQSIKPNAQSNENKATKLKQGQWLFLV